MVVFCCTHCFAEVPFHVTLDDAVVAECGASGRQTGKLSDALAIVLKGIEIIGPNDVFFRDIKSGCVSDGQEFFFLLEQGDMTRGMAGSVISPCSRRKKIS